MAHSCSPSPPFHLWSSDPSVSPPAFAAIDGPQPPLPWSATSLRHGVPGSGGSGRKRHHAISKLIGRRHGVPCVGRASRPRSLPPPSSSAASSPNPEPTPLGGSAGATPTVGSHGPALLATVVSSTTTEQTSSRPTEDDSLPAPEIRLHIAMEVVSRLDMAEEHRLLSVEEKELRQFLKAHVASLQVALGINGVANPVPDDLCVEKPVTVAAVVQRPTLVAIQIKHVWVATPGNKGLKVDQPVVVSVAAQSIAPISGAIQIKPSRAVKKVASGCKLMGVRTKAGRMTTIEVVRCNAPSTVVQSTPQHARRAPLCYSPAFVQD